MKNYYNEKRYLNNDIEALNHIKEDSIKYLENINEELDRYNEIKDDYKLFIEEVIDELLSYNLSNSLEYSIVLNYLIDNGYLSIDNLFIHKDTNKELKSLLGISIITGEGCCRNISSIHKDIFDKLSLYDKLFYCYQGFGNGHNKHANHVINLIHYDNNIYGIDLHNKSNLYYFKDSMKMKLISEYNSDTLTYKPYYELIVNESNIDTIKETINSFNDYSKRNSLSSLEYDEIKYDIISNMNNKSNELDTFSNKTKTIKKIINSKINK